MSTLKNLKFVNLALKTLPLDTEKENYVRQVPGACFSRVGLTPVENPTLVAASIPALGLLDITESDVESEDFAEYFAGNKLLPGSETAAHCYCGHQFGYFSGQLGDGAAMYLGEVLNKKGERWEIQLKGSGKTPYSRHADGRKVLRSTIREFLCSEAIHNLGIPTTRAGTCVTSDSLVVRDIFYDGHPIEERCSIVLRIAPTFLRFGSFEIFKQTDRETGRKGPSVGRQDILVTMLDYTIKNLYPEIWQAHNSDKETMYVEFYKDVVRRTARLVAKWQCVGWCHGVLNTDNMSIVGVTIDYGPYGFMDAYDPGYVCNASDDSARYSYQKQPEICKWNCKKLAEAIQGAVPMSKTEPEMYGIYDEVYSTEYTKGMRNKLGLLNKQLAEDGKLVESLMDTMHKTGADFTNCFRCLSRVPLPGESTFDSSVKEVIEYILSQCATVEEMKLTCKPRMDPRQFQMFLMLMETNPGMLPALGRGFIAVQQELERLEKRKELEEKTEDSQREENMKLWQSWFDEYKTRLEKELEGITDVIEANTKRKDVMNSSNPSENMDLTGIDHTHKEASEYSTSTKDEEKVEGAKGNSYSDKGSNSCQTSHVGLLYDGKPPDWSVDLRVT
ncbi:hypothetical protein FSP39_014502 [Pinctada imbricata]|uniref:Selenoprotein O n=1 Tax=Pinctada imbricata TaxID=66713 RepID=A0AA88YJU9_PINIB|nr:hypothetical protein FSP39_014502 [Pinctada imbricata]